MHATASSAESLRGISAQAHGRESAFHRISGAQMLPVLRRIIKVAQASIQISDQASGRFGIALLPFTGQLMCQALGGGTGAGQIDGAHSQRRFLAFLPRQFVEYVTHLVKPATLTLRVRPNFRQGSPET